MRETWRTGIFRTCVALLLLPGGATFAQPAGHPISTGSDRELTVSLEAGNFRHSIAGVSNESLRFISRTTLGLGGRFDVYVLLGLAKLRLEPGAGAASMQDRFRPAYGGGFVWHFLQRLDSGFSLFSGIRFLRFQTEPSARETQSVANVQVVKLVRLNYDWREVNMTFGLNKTFAAWNFYAGINHRAIFRKERRAEELLLNGSGASISEARATYRSGFVASPLLGLEVSLPARAKLNFEMNATGKKAYAFYIGISQTGLP